MINCRWKMVKWLHCNGFCKKKRQRLILHVKFSNAVHHKYIHYINALLLQPTMSNEMQIMWRIYALCFHHSWCPRAFYYCTRKGGAENGGSPVSIVFLFVYTLAYKANLQLPIPVWRKISPVIGIFQPFHNEGSQWELSVCSICQINSFICIFWVILM